jgi:lauroyl/myristoyl acyltransferase
MLITTSGGMILPGKDVQIERKCGDRTATAMGAGGENEAARRRNLSECIPEATKDPNTTVSFTALPTAFFSGNKPRPFQSP